ncbi:hypothetical protein Cgig2_030354 [Carnegiea gigantea]|uniref:RABX5 catalytic core helical domain-containing protein n=1 Tax=Carnegiea gigantea TaxID=171969 RepID=A0A9Q1KJF1_9CARY|nr:hypothetical protein Cgig2_030354 [Carnegiea gigantea]
MEKGEMFSSSTVQLTWHDFLERMRQPSAAEFVRAIKSFIVSFSNNPPDPERDSAAVQQFLLNMEAAFRAHPLWAGCSEEELESAGEGLEKYVMTKLFTRVFASVPDDVKVDEHLSEKMALVQQFIRPENLDIKPTFQNESSWLDAQKVGFFKNEHVQGHQREKIVWNLLNCCKGKSSPAHSNLLYIQRRGVNPEWFQKQPTTSLTFFLLNLHLKTLSKGTSMDEGEFDRKIGLCSQALSI